MAASPRASRETRRSTRWALAVPLVLCGALVLRLLGFHSYASGWDSCEYVFAVEEHYLPHSPYVLYLWLGLALAQVLPAALGLSLLSLAGGLAAVFLIARLVERQSGNRGAGLLAAAAFAVFPVCVWESGIQEVYALQTALVLGALVAAGGDGLRRAAAAGFVFGAAFAVHNGSLFLAPAFGYALLAGGPAGLRRWTRRAAAALGAGLVLPLAAYAWTAGLFAGAAPGGWYGAWRLYLRGIAPGLNLSTRTAGDLLEGALSFCERALAATTGSPVTAGLVLLAALAAVLRKKPRHLVLWLLYAVPYAIYEAVLGSSLDRGLYMPFVAPWLAALPALALASLETALPRRRAAWAMALVLLGPAVFVSVEQGRSVPSRAEFLSSELQLRLRWIRDNVAGDAYLVQPEGVENPNLQPCYTGHRPVIYLRQRFRILDGGRWTPLAFPWFRTLTDARLDALLTDGVEIVSLTPYPELARGPRRWRPRTMELVTREGTRSRPIYVLELGER